MKSFTNQSLFALAFVAVLSSCSRPYATFQKSTPDHFYSKATVAPADAPAVESPAQPVEALAAEVVVSATPATVDTELQKVEALVSNKAGLSTNKKLTRNLAHVKAMVTEMQAKVAAPASTVGTMSTAASVAPQKMNLVQRLVAKSIDKKIKHNMAPEKTMARSLLTIGVVVGLIGLLLLLIGTGTVATLGYVGLIVGIILVIASLI